MSSKDWIAPLATVSVVGLLVILAAGGCPTTPGGTTGDAAAGQTLFSQECSGCHTAAALAPARSRITNDLGTINAAMNGITLTDQQVADLQAYLATQ